MVIPNTASREQAYLSSIAHQPKDANPDRIYEVCDDVLARLGLSRTDSISHRLQSDWVELRLYVARC